MILNTLIDSIESVWPMLTIFLVVIITIRITYLRINRERFVFYKEFGNLFFVIYILLLFQLLTNAELNNIGGLNLVPFTEILRYEIGSMLFYYNVIGNILIFVPFGYFVSVYIKAKKISHIFFISIISSLTVEFVQLQIGRSFDIDDILLNVVGSIIGFLIYVSLNAIRKHLPKFFQSDLFYNILCLIICLFFIYCYYKSIGFGWL